MIREVYSSENIGKLGPRISQYPIKERNKGTSKREETREEEV